MSYYKEPEWLGHGNDAPPNSTQIEEDEFWRRFLGSPAAPCAHRWLVRPDVPEFLKNESVWVWVDEFEKAGVGCNRVVEHARTVKPTKFFRFFVCDHQMVETGSPGKARSFNCLHTYKCRKCDHTYTVDSSG